MPSIQESTDVPFNPALLGTSDSRWLDALVESPEWHPGKNPLLVVSPHPDDEVFGAGGLMSCHARAGCHVSVLSVTDGEAAYREWKGLNRIRRIELDGALELLTDGKVETRHLGIPDGEVECHRGRLFDALSGLISRDVTLIAPYERDGHPDHDATGAVCADIARLHGLTLVRYPVWAWHHKTPEQFTNINWGRFELDATVRLRKARAIERFRSQLEPRGGSPIVPRHVLPYFKRSYEAFLL